MAQTAGQANRTILVGASYHNDISPPVRELPAWSDVDVRRGAEREANENPKIPYRHHDTSDPIVQGWHVSPLGFVAPNIPLPIRNFDGVGYPGVGCNCAPPDTNGAVGCDAVCPDG